MTFWLLTMLLLLKRSKEFVVEFCVQKLFGWISVLSSIVMIYHDILHSLINWNLVWKKPVTSFTNICHKPRTIKNEKYNIQNNFSVKIYVLTLVSWINEGFFGEKRKKSFDSEHEFKFKRILFFNHKNNDKLICEFWGSLSFKGLDL